MAGHAAKRASRLIQQRTNDFIQKQKGPKWKRELVQDHKFDYIDVEEFRTHSCYVGFRYLFLYLAITISILTYIADLWTAGILLIFNTWSLSEQPKIPFDISKWIFVGCIILSFLLVAWDFHKARGVLKSRDISLGVTNIMAYRYYSVRDYAKFCLFRKINDSRKSSDMCAFFVFYTLKGWKKLLFAQSPRQIISGVTVYALLRSAWTAQNGQFQINSDWDVYGKNWQQRVALISMSFTCIIWVLSMLEMITACLLYIPVFCQIQGNLKEYCCHKIDKRIAELLEKQKRKRLRDLEKGQRKGSKKKNKKGFEDMYDENLPLRNAAAPPSTEQFVDVKSEMSSYADSYAATPAPRRAYQQQSSYYDPQGYYEMQSYPSSQQWTPPTPGNYHPSPAMSPAMSPLPQHYSPNLAAGPAPPRPYGDGLHSNNSYFR